MFGINASKVTTWQEVFSAPGVPGPTGTTLSNPLLTPTGGVNGLAPSAANLVDPQRPLGTDTLQLSTENIFDVAMHGTAFLPNLLADVTLPWVPGGMPPNAAGANTFSSRADALEITADGLIYQNRKAGDFTKMKSASGDFEIQAHQEQYNGIPVTTKLAVKLGCDVVVVDASAHTLTVNGVPVGLQPGQSFPVMNGGTLTRTTAGTYMLTSAQGDLVSIAEHDPGYIDFFGTPSFARQAGELQGELGTVDGTGVGELVGRDGQTYPHDQLEAFQETWRVPPGKSLFGAFPRPSTLPGSMPPWATPPSSFGPPAGLLVGPPPALLVTRSVDTKTA